TENFLKNSLLINKGLKTYFKDIGRTDFDEVFGGIVNERTLRLSFFYFETGRPLKFIYHLLSGIFFQHQWNKRMLKDALYYASPNSFEKLKKLSFR
ncbi:MAG: hypothetical protein JKX84_02720, partial [Flavobacteriales bacterium]|nr:hypothetical protein [Flavobacteriales bacterium]